MKNSVMKWRLGTAAVLLVALAACGGYTTVNLGGTVSGLVTSGLILANGGATVTVPANATSYVFPAQIDDHGKFSVTVQSQPARYTCFVSGGTGLATGIPITSANVICNVNTYSVGGSVSGLRSTGLTLVNGSDNLLIDPAKTSFTFANYVADGTVYGVTVLTQPAGQICTVSNGTATMGAAAVTNIAVNCQ